MRGSRPGERRGGRQKGTPNKKTALTQAAIAARAANENLSPINATELRTGSAFRFGTLESGSWRCGKLHRNDISVAHAVAASAAYPLFLPAFDETHTFDEGGKLSSGRVVLTDGGIYDNLGLGCLWPDRSPDISMNVIPIDTIICCSAGYGLRQDPPSQFIFARMLSVFSTTFERAQKPRRADCMTRSDQEK